MLDLTGLILYHYNWIDLNEIMVCMADVHDEAVPVSNEQAPTSDGEDGGSASDDLPDMSAPPLTRAPQATKDPRVPATLGSHGLTCRPLPQTSVCRGVPPKWGCPQWPRRAIVR